MMRTLDTTDLRILAANRSLGELVGRPPAELIGEPFDRLLSHTKAPAWTITTGDAAVRVAVLDELTTGTYRRILDHSVRFQAALSFLELQLEDANAFRGDVVDHQLVSTARLVDRDAAVGEDSAELMGHLVEPVYRALFGGAADAHAGDDRLPPARERPHPVPQPRPRHRRVAADGDGDALLLGVDAEPGVREQL